MSSPDAEYHHPAILLWRRLQGWLPYLGAAAVLLSLLAVGDKFWLGNDDIEMGMLVSGYGIAASPSPVLAVESSPVWGWLAMHVPDVAGIRGYTLATYAVMLFALFCTGAALRRMRVPGTHAAAALLVLGAGPLLYPQFTQVAGYLAAAGFALVLASDDEHLIPSLLGAALCLLLAGLIRYDEAGLVLLIVSPFLLDAWLRHGWRWRLHWAAVACLCALTVGLTLYCGARATSGGTWAAFSDIDALRSQFTDFGLGAYYLHHPGRLAGSHLSTNDITLLTNWFYLDPTVFNSGTVGPLVDQLSIGERLHMNAGRYADVLQLFTAPELLVPLGLFLASAWFGWPRSISELVSLALLLLFMFAIGFWGRPGALRIYLPIVGAMLVLTQLKQSERARRPAQWAGMLALAASLSLCGNYYWRSHQEADDAAPVRAETCALLPRDRLIVVWASGAKFGWRHIYRPTTPAGDSCERHIYSIGTYELAAPSLAQLHAYTGGQDFIPALLSGMHFYLVVREGRLQLLKNYLREHYGYVLRWQLLSPAQDSDFQAYDIAAMRAD